MDGKNENGGEAYSRTPTAEDLKKICSALEENKAEYVLVGGWAVNIHGYARATEDIDLLVNPAPENIRRVKKALSILPDNAVAEMNDDDVQELSVIRIADEVVIDLMGKIADVNTGNAGKITTEFQGVKINVADLETLIKTKQGVRPKDQMDLAFLLRKKYLQENKGNKMQQHEPYKEL